MLRLKMCHKIIQMKAKMHHLIGHKMFCDVADDVSEQPFPNII